MREADFNYADFDPNAQAQQDSTLLVKFFTKAVEDQAATKEAGRPIFTEKEYIDIRIPGSRECTNRPATYRDKQRFPRHYAAFKQRTEAPVEGTPLSEWGSVSRSLAEELSFQNIKTVEQLAACPDANLQNLRIGGTLKQKAIRWLERAKKDVSVDKLEKELKQRDDEINILKAQMNELMEKVNADKPKRGRKRASQPSSSGGGAGPGSGPLDE